MPRLSPPPLVALEGASASGKTTVVRRMATEGPFVPIFEATDRLRPAPSLLYRNRAELLRIERRLLTEDCRRYREARQLQWGGSSVLLDTDFLGPLTYSIGLEAGFGPEHDVVPELVRAYARRWVAKEWGLADLYVYLDVPVTVLRHRAAGDPSAHPSELMQRHLRVAAIERRLWRTVIAPVLPGRVRWVNGTGSRPRLARRIADAIRRSGRPRPSFRSDAGRVLAALRQIPRRARGNR